MNKFLASVAGAGGVGTAGALGYGIHDGWFSSESQISFKSRINKEERVILDEAHASVWKQLLTEYKDKSKAKHLIKRIGQDSPTEQEFKNWCSGKHESTSVDESEFNSYVSWCTRENLITKLKGKSKNWNHSTENSGWANAKSSYNSNETEDIRIPAESGNEKIAKDAITEEQLKNYCKKASSMPFVSDTDVDFKRSEKWCVSQ
ncbi:hypothetical protein HF1_07910 [Mycoplasma haemofelis str. Langford 1]|uniref:Uncharacterized protein n=1 Tax=Mycoplasma haemofelis (strain Langford 1) TaxID=941640 RepID=E8ZI28_MYCHL|nr:hypothetical protein [Mycoplasma haemofelis]CBY92799.1 hypothetical protein HF1_07910 [Mycoplasma haemofelis str. Langford 1]